LKTCIACNLSKTTDSFVAHAGTADGVANQCRECANLKDKLYRKTKKGLISRIYGEQKKRSKRRGHAPPSYTCDELRWWMLGQVLFKELFEAWELSGYAKNLVPSIDRIDSTKGYDFSNIQVMTWEENNFKGRKERKRYKK